MLDRRHRLRTVYEISGGRGRIRTSVARKERQVYSLLPLAARPPVRPFTRSDPTKARSQLRGNYKDTSGGVAAQLGPRGSPGDGFQGSPRARRGGVRPKFTP